MIEGYKVSHKLVRDKIPDIIRAEGGVPELRSAAPGERLGLLLEKLREEVSELEEAPCAEECADVLEVLFAISDQLGMTKQQLFDVAAEKLKSRGGFQQGYILKIGGG